METEGQPRSGREGVTPASRGEAILSSSPHESREQTRFQGQSLLTPAVTHEGRISGAQDNEIHFLFLFSNF